MKTKNKWIEYLKDNERKYNDGLKKLHTAIDKLVNSLTPEQRLFLLELDCNE